MIRTRLIEDRGGWLCTQKGGTRVIRYATPVENTVESWGEKEEGESVTVRRRGAT